MQGCSGLVLAAGWSRRFGRPKALLPCGPAGESFVVRAVRTLRSGGIAEVLVIGRPEDDALRQEVGRVVPPARYVENPNAAEGQLSSLLAGLAQATAAGAAAVMVIPVDYPQVRAETVAALLRALDAGGASIVRAVHRGRHGHPVIFTEDVFADLRRADPAVGAKAVIRANPARLLDVEVGDPGVLRDVDVPADYVDLFPDSE